MIFSEQTSGVGMDLLEYSISELPRIVTTLPEVQASEFCLFDYECCYTEIASVYPTDVTDTYRNDKTSILITLLDDSSTFEFKLVKGDTEILLNSNLYGDFFDKGSFTDQPLKAGYVIDWVKVYNLNGGGLYKIVVSQTDFGDTVTKESWNYSVKVFSEQLVDKTVKLVSTHEGIVQNVEDYEGLIWKRYIRLPGTFGQRQPIPETDTFETVDRKLEQIQDKQLFEYTLETGLIISEVALSLLKDRFLSNRLEVTNYDYFAHEKFEDYEVYPLPTSEEPTYYPFNSKVQYNFVFSDKDQSTVKRNIF